MFTLRKRLVSGVGETTDTAQGSCKSRQNVKKEAQLWRMTWPPGHTLFRVKCTRRREQKRIASFFCFARSRRHSRVGNKTASRNWTNERINSVPAGRISSHAFLCGPAGAGWMLTDVSCFLCHVGPHYSEVLIWVCFAGCGKTENPPKTAGCSVNCFHSLWSRWMNKKPLDQVCSVRQQFYQTIENIVSH